MSVLVTPAGYIGDFSAGSAGFFRFNTHTTAGAPITIAAPAIEVLQDDDTENATVSAITADHDATGQHLVEFAAPATAGDYSVVLTAGTVDSQSVAGMVLALFSVRNRAVEELRKLAQT
jgi:hypothetical protein